MNRKILQLMSIVLVYGCAKYQIVDKKKPGEVLQGPDAQFRGEVLCQETIEGNASVCRSADGQFMIRGEPREVFVGDPVQFSGTCYGNPVLDWNFGDNSSSQSGQPNKRYSRPGSFSVIGKCVTGGRPLQGSITIIVKSRGGIIDQPGIDPGQSPVQF